MCAKNSFNREIRIPKVITDLKEQISKLKEQLAKAHAKLDRM